MYVLCSIMSYMLACGLWTCPAFIHKMMNMFTNSDKHEASRKNCAHHHLILYYTACISFIKNVSKKLKESLTYFSFQSSYHITMHA